MKSRTSFFDPTVFWKNTTRFAPAWALYAVLMFMIMLTFAGSEAGAEFAVSLGEMTHFTGAAAMLCAFVYAQLLFGDLYSSRMCNALHAMPIRRETWFATNVLSGLAFWTVPNGLFTVIFLLLTGGVWEAPLLWFAVAMLQYLFFFGIAVLSAYCVGNRFAMALVYGLVNFLSLILYWLVANLYEPLLFGLTVPEDIFSLLCPAVHLIGDSYFQVRCVFTLHTVTSMEIVYESGWLYLGISAAVGLGALALALVLYRRRNLECAGDFMAVRRLGPVFLILYTFCAGVFCHGFNTLFLGEENYVFLVLGLAIGFFTGLMLLHRTVRIFQKKTFLAFSCLAAAFVLSLALTAWDPLGITRWIPDADQVENVQITTGASHYGTEDGPELERAEDIEKVLRIHEICLNSRNRTAATQTAYMNITIRYQLKNGQTRQRDYGVDLDRSELEQIRPLLSRPEAVLGDIYTNPDSAALVRAELSGEELAWTTEDELESLVDAIVRDCEAGNMAQDWAFAEEADYIGWIVIETRQPNGLYYARDIRIHEDCANVMAWLKAAARWTPADSDKFADGK